MRSSPNKTRKFFIINKEAHSCFLTIKPLQESPLPIDNQTLLQISTIRTNIDHQKYEDAFEFVNSNCEIKTPFYKEIVDHQIKNGLYEDAINSLNGPALDLNIEDRDSRLTAIAQACSLQIPPPAHSRFCLVCITLANLESHPISCGLHVLRGVFTTNTTHLNISWTLALHCADSTYNKFRKKTLETYIDIFLSIQLADDPAIHNALLNAKFSTILREIMEQHLLIGQHAQLHYCSRLRDCKKFLRNPELYDTLDRMRKNKVPLLQLV